MTSWYLHVFEIVSRSEATFLLIFPSNIFITISKIVFAFSNELPCLLQVNSLTLQTSKSMPDRQETMKIVLLSTKQQNLQPGLNYKRRILFVTLAVYLPIFFFTLSQTNQSRWSNKGERKAFRTRRRRRN